jgi:hypothetical protein
MKINLKLNLILSAYCAIIVASGCTDNKNTAEIPKVFKSFIPQSTTFSQYKEIIPYHEGNKMPIPKSITKSEALEDIKMMEYLLSTSYSGYEYWKSKGVDFDSYFLNLRDFVADKDTVQTITFEKELSKILKQIYDGHISFSGFGYNMAYRHKAVYYCDILLEKIQNDVYEVIDSQNDMVKVGDLFTQKNREAHLFRTLSPPGKHHFLVGMFSFNVITSKELSFNNKILKIPFHKSRLLFSRFNDPEPFYITRKSNIPIVRVTGFANILYPKMKKFMNAGIELKNEKTIIVNLINNGGGSSVFPQAFIKNLNGEIQWETFWAELTSPAITEFYAKFDKNATADISPEYRDMIIYYGEKFNNYRKSPIKSWQFYSTNKQNIPGSYEGRLVLLTNRRVLSAGEGMVGASQSVKNRMVIGENTGGVAQFSSTCGYYLPNSKIITNLPRQLIIIPGLEECIGYLPDYWLDTMDPLNEVLRWLENSENYQFTYSNSYKEMLKNMEMDAALPKNAKAITPSSDIPKDLAQYSGKWYGLSDGILEHLLLVEKISNSNDIDAIYAWGVAYQWNINEPGWNRYKGKFQKNKLVLTDKNASIKITYSINADGTMNGIYERPGIYSQTELTKLD